MRVRSFQRAIGFVDWHTAVIASGAALRHPRPDSVARAALEHVERILSDHLSKSGGGSRFRVRLRLYTGWHRGKTPTDYHRGIVKVLKDYADRHRPHHQGRVIFEGGRDGVQLGNRLACVPERLAKGNECHLLDTLRNRNGIDQEKMVDTALAVDLLGLTTRREADRYVVVSDDDDLLPGLLAAEAAGADAKLLSRPGTSSRFMAHTADLIHTYESVGA